MCPAGISESQRFVGTVYRLGTFCPAICVMDSIANGAVVKWQTNQITISDNGQTTSSLTSISSTVQHIMRLQPTVFSCVTRRPSLVMEPREEQAGAQRELGETLQALCGAIDSMCIVLTSRGKVCLEINSYVIDISLQECMNG